jgi:hypothetical protein
MSCVRESVGHSLARIGATQQSEGSPRPQSAETERPERLTSGSAQFSLTFFSACCGSVGGAGDERQSDFRKHPECSPGP